MLSMLKWILLGRLFIMGIRNSIIGPGTGAESGKKADLLTYPTMGIFEIYFRLECNYVCVIEKKC